jgi:hypothetical protein
MAAVPRPGSPPSSRSQKPVTPRPLSAREAARGAVSTNGVSLDLPLVGHLDLPPPYHLVWYAGVATLAAIEVIEWPIAAILAVGKALADNHHSRVLMEFGEALEESG